MMSQHDARAVLRRAAVAVVAAVGLGAEEGAEDVAVGAVELDAVEAGLLGAHGGGDEVLGQLLDLAGGERAGAGLGVFATGRPAPRRSAPRASAGRRGAAAPSRPRPAALIAAASRVRPGRWSSEKTPSWPGKPWPMRCTCAAQVITRPKPPSARKVSQWNSSSDSAPVRVALAVGQRRQHEAVVPRGAAGEGEGRKEFMHAHNRAKRRTQPPARSILTIGTGGSSI